MFYFIKFHFSVFEGSSLSVGQLSEFICVHCLVLGMWQAGRGWELLERSSVTRRMGVPLNCSRPPSYAATGGKDRRSERQTTKGLCINEVLILWCVFDLLHISSRALTQFEQSAQAQQYVMWLENGTIFVGQTRICSFNNSLPLQNPPAKSH